MQLVICVLNKRLVIEYIGTAGADRLDDLLPVGKIHRLLVCPCDLRTAQRQIGIVFIEREAVHFRTGIAENQIRRAEAELFECAAAVPGLGHDGLRTHLDAADNIRALIDKDILRRCDVLHHFAAALLVLLAGYKGVAQEVGMHLIGIVLYDLVIQQLKAVGKPRKANLDKDNLIFVHRLLRVLCIGPRINPAQHTVFMNPVFDLFQKPVHISNRTAL